MRPCSWCRARKHDAGASGGKALRLSMQRDMPLPRIQPAHGWPPWTWSGSRGANALACPRKSGGRGVQGARQPLAGEGCNGRGGASPLPRGAANGRRGAVLPHPTSSTSSTSSTSVWSVSYRAHYRVCGIGGENFLRLPVPTMPFVDAVTLQDRVFPMPLTTRAECCGLGVNRCRGARSPSARRMSPHLPPASARADHAVTHQTPTLPRPEVNLTVNNLPLAHSPPSKTQKYS